MHAYYPSSSSPNYRLHIFFCHYYLNINLITDYKNIQSVKHNNNKPLYNISIKKIFFKNPTQFMPLQIILDEKQAFQFIEQQKSQSTSLRYILHGVNYYQIENNNTLLDTLQYQFLQSIPTNKKEHLSENDFNQIKSFIQQINDYCYILISKEGL